VRGVDEDKGESNCSDPRHFHAWCRLPNQFQHREIREKALAAKARKTRQLRDPETDGYAILEENLDAIARKGDEAVDLLVEELVGREWWTDYAEAAKDVQELEEGVDENEQPIRPYEHVERDEARLEELRELPEEQRPKDEIEELERHLARYAEALKKRQEEIVAPKREALKKNGLNGLLDLVRDQRVLAAGTDEFMHVFSTWSWLVGTLPPAGRRARVAARPERAPQRRTRGDRGRQGDVRGPRAHRATGARGKLMTDEAWIDTVRLVRDTGSVRELFPPGFTTCGTSRTRCSRRSAWR
jgi:hypothetical protein